MLGPIFNAEMLRAARRGRTHVLRWLYAGWLCLQLVYEYDQTHAAVTYGIPPRAPVSQSHDDTSFGRQYRDLVLSQQFILIVLVTPAFVAGGVTDEKTRGTLAGLLTAYVTPADIVLGKLAARCAQVGILALTPLPMLALVAQYAGITPGFLICLLAVTVLVLVGLGGVSMLASVWARQTRTAVIGTYVGLAAAAWLLNFAVVSGWLPWECKGYFDPLRPLWLALDRSDPGEAFRQLGPTALAWGGLGLVTTTVAVWQLRPAYLRQLGSRSRRRAIGRLMGRPRPVRDVIAWKECYVGRRIPAWLGLPVTCTVGAAVTSYALSGMLISGPWRGFVPYTLISLGWYALLLLTLVVGVRCSGAITGERERQTWDGLMTSPLSPRELVRGKLSGVLRATTPYLLAVWLGAAVVAALSSESDPSGAVYLMLIGAGLAGLIFGFFRRAGRWTLVGLILWLAGTGGVELAAAVALALGVTWLAMYFLGAVGLYCSARSKSSWRSLLGTLVIGYAGGSLAFCVGIPFGCVGSIVVMVVLGLAQAVITGGTVEPYMSGRIVQIMWPMTVSIGAGFVFWQIARWFLISAENIVKKRDRIPPDWVRMIEDNLPRHDPYRSNRRVRR